jgi:hypothetical protein
MGKVYVLGGKGEKKEQKAMIGTRLDTLSNMGMKKGFVPSCVYQHREKRREPSPRFPKRK